MSPEPRRGAGSHEDMDATGRVDDGVGPRDRGERLFRVLLRAYPKPFRARYGVELMAFFRADRERPEHRGGAGAVRFWSRTVADLAGVAWTERVDRRRPRVRERSGGGIQGLAIDFRQAWTGLRRSRGFVLPVVVTFGLGIGAATTVFSVIHGVLLTPLPVPDAERVVQVEERELGNPAATYAAWGNYVDLRESGVFEELSAWTYNSVTWTGGPEARRLVAREVTASFFRVVGLTPVAGRPFTEREQVEGEHRVVVLSDRVWQSAFGGDRNVLGSVMTLDGEPYTVIGVMPPGFDFPFGAEAWVPLRPVTDPIGLRRWHRHRMTGRLAAGLTIEQTQALATQLAERLQREHPETNEGNVFVVSPELDEYVADVRPALRLLMGAVAFLLLIACVNIAGLLVARSVRRAGETEIRAALGATRARLARLMVAEALVLGLFGCVLGSALAVIGVRVALALAGEAIPRAANVGLHTPVLLFAVLISAGAAILVSALPAARVGRVSSGPPYTGPRLSAGRGAARLRRGLVVVQFAVALVLTTGTVLLTRSLLRMAAIDPGIEPDPVITAVIRLPPAQYADRADVARYFTRLLPAIEAVPGVERAAATLTAPIEPEGWQNSLTIRSRPAAESERPTIRYVTVSPGYFEAIGARLAEGRDFEMRELGGPAAVAIVNRAAASRYWPDRPALAEEIMGDDSSSRPWLRIVGIVDDFRQSLTEPAQPEVYVPIQFDRVLTLTVMVRTKAGSTPSVLRTVPEVIAAQDGDVPIIRIGMLSDRIEAAVAGPRFNARLMSIFAGLALLLASVGAYGVLDFVVSSRRREIGIRTAVGASRLEIITLVLREAGVIAGAGILLGLVVSAIVSRAMSGMLFEIEPGEPTTLIVAVIMIAAVALAAAARPAWTAASIDPLESLRPES